MSLAFSGLLLASDIFQQGITFVSLSIYKHSKLLFSNSITYGFVHKNIPSSLSFTA